MSDRYKVGGDSQVEHSCCYSAVVVDTTQPIIIANKHYKGQYRVVCECPDPEDAQLIVEALNK